MAPRPDPKSLDPDEIAAAHAWAVTCCSSQVWLDGGASMPKADAERLLVEHWSAALTTPESAKIAAGLPGRIILADLNTTGFQGDARKLESVARTCAALHGYVALARRLQPSTQQRTDEDLVAAAPTDLVAARHAMFDAAQQMALELQVGDLAYIEQLRNAPLDPNYRPFSVSEIYIGTGTDSLMLRGYNVNQPADPSRDTPQWLREARRQAQDEHGRVVREGGTWTPRLYGRDPKGIGGAVFFTPTQMRLLFQARGAEMAVTNILRVGAGRDEEIDVTRDRRGRPVLHILEGGTLAADVRRRSKGGERNWEKLAEVARRLRGIETPREPIAFRIEQWTERRAWITPVGELGPTRLLFDTHEQFENCRFPPTAPEGSLTDHESRLKIEESRTRQQLPEPTAPDADGPRSGRVRDPRVVLDPLLGPPSGRPTSSPRHRDSITDVDRPDDLGLEGPRFDGP